MSKRYYKIPSKNIEVTKKIHYPFEKREESAIVRKIENIHKTDNIALKNLPKKQFNELGDVARVKAKIMYVNKVVKEKPISSVVNIINYWLKYQ